MGSRKGSLSAIPRPTRVNRTTSVVNASTSRINMTVVRFKEALGSEGPGFLDLRDLKQNNNYNP